MTTAAQAELVLELPPQPWVRPSRKGGCGRNLTPPDNGPGTCHHWWDSCPRAEARGCFMLWIREMKARGLTETDMAELMGMAGSTKEKDDDRH